MEMTREGHLLRHYFFQTNEGGVAVVSKQTKSYKSKAQMPGVGASASPPSPTLGITFGRQICESVIKRLVKCYLTFLSSSRCLISPELDGVWFNVPINNT
jgi:hypothetical protein